MVIVLLSVMGTRRLFIPTYAPSTSSVPVAPETPATLSKLNPIVSAHRQASIHSSPGPSPKSRATPLRSALPTPAGVITLTTQTPTPTPLPQSPSPLPQRMPRLNAGAIHSSMPSATAQPSNTPIVIPSATSAIVADSPSPTDNPNIGTGPRCILISPKTERMSDVYHDPPAAEAVWLQKWLQQFQAQTKQTILNISDVPTREYQFLPNGPIDLFEAANELQRQHRIAILSQTPAAQADPQQWNFTGYMWEVHCWGDYQIRIIDSGFGA